MNLRLFVSCGLACTLLALTGCDEGRQPPGRVIVRVANVAPGFAELTHRREQDARSDATLLFKQAQEFAYDADTYDFSALDRAPFDATLTRRSWTYSPQLEANSDYLFVLTEAGAEVHPIVIAVPGPPATDAQFLALHAASGSPAMDLYLERPGVGIAGATPRGSFNAQEQIAPRTLPSGDYELTLTAAGDPSAVLLATATLTLPANTHTSFIVVPEAGQGSQTLSLFVLQGSTTVVTYDRNATSELRVLNGATDRAPRDFMVDNEFSPPLFSAMPFGTQTAYAEIPLSETTKISVTPVGNPGVLELDQTYAGVLGQRATMLFTGPAGALVPAFNVDDGRRFHYEAKLRVMNAATQFAGGVDFVLVPPDADPNLSAAFASLLPPGLTVYLPVPPAEYDLYLRQLGTATVISGPTRITVAAGGLYSALAIDGPDTATAGILLLDDFP